MKDLFLVIIVLALANSIVAQDIPIIEYDEDKESLKSGLPYDKPFIIKVPYVEDLMYVNYLQVRNGRNWHQEIKNQFDKKKTPEVNQLDQGLIRPIKEGEKRYHYLHFNEKHTLKPNKDYAIIINRVDLQGIKLIDKYFDNDTIATAGWAKELDKLDSIQRRSFGFSYTLPRFKIDSSDNKNSINQVDSLFKKNPKLYEKYVEWELLSDSLQRFVNNFEISTDWVETFKCIIYDTLKTNCSYCPDLNSLVRLSSLNKNQIQELVNGNTTIITEVPKNNYEGRISNIKETLNALEATFYRINVLALSDQCPKASIEPIKKVNEALAHTLKLLEKINDTRKVIIQTITSQFFNVPVSINATTSVFNAIARGKARIIPDFGLAAYGFQEDFTGFTPYLGVHFNFVPIDKSIPWRKYPKKNIKHYTSAMLGWTLAGLSEEGKREDLFNNQSFLLGVGIKPYSHVIQITGGVILFNRINENPVISNKDLTATPFVGISIDAELKDLLDGIIGIFK